jgi:hypothetical protein
MTRLEQLRVSVGPPPLVVPRNVTTMLWRGYNGNLGILGNTGTGISDAENVAVENTLLRVPRARMENNLPI